MADAGSSCAAASGTGNLATTVTLEAGDRATFTVTGLIAANATGLLVNTATVTAPAGAVDGDTANNTATSTVTLTPSADVQVTKSGPATAVAGTNVVYTITVTNAGPSDATGVTLADPTPPGLTFVSNAGDCTTAFPCNLGTLPPAATRTITATFAIPSGYTTPDPIANTATVSSPTPDAAAGNNSATATTSLGTAVTDLHITKTNGVNGVVAGLPTTYTITITNPLGPSDASGATVTDTFPTTLTGVTWTCTGTGGGACPASGSGDINTPVTVPVGATVVFTATGTVNPAATGVLVNSAQVLPPAGHANRTSAIATDSDPITARADLGITKTGPASIVAGNNLVYTITVTNTGPSDAAGVVVSDATPTGLVFVSNTGDCTTAFPCALGVVPAGATRTITATFTVPITYPGLGPIVNVASVSATTPDDTAANNTATVETTLNRNADVAISKSVSPAVGARGPADHLHRGGDQSRAGARHRPRRPGPAPGRPVVRVGLRLAGQLRGRHRGVDDRDAAERAIGDADARGDGDRGRRHHQPRAGRRAGPARPRGEQQLGGGDRERRRQRRRRRDQDRRPAGAVGGRNRDLHGDGDQQRAEPRHRGGRHRCAARGPDARVGHAVAGHLRGARLDRRHAQRDRARGDGHADDRGDGHGARRAGQYRDHHAADGSGSECRPTTARA